MVRKTTMGEKSVYFIDVGYEVCSAFLQSMQSCLWSKSEHKPSRNHILSQKMSAFLQQ